MAVRYRQLTVALVFGTVISLSPVDAVAARGQTRRTLLYPAAPGARGHLALVPSSALVPDIDLSRVRAWILAAREHQPGQPDAAARSIAAWPTRTLEIALTDVSELSQMLVFLRLRASEHVPGAQVEYRHRRFSVEGDLQSESLDELFALTAEQRTAGHANALLKRGALLHTDIATILPVNAAAGAFAPPVDQGTVRVADGEVLGLEGNSQHWIYARFLLEAVSSQPARTSIDRWDDFAADPTHDDQVRQWYQATSAWQAIQHRWSEAISTIARGRELFPGDARLLFYSGAMHEVFAAPEVQAAAQSAVRAGIGVGVVVDRKELELAEGLLRQALAIEPDSAEMRLRLGRVLQRLDRHQEAAREFKTAAGALTDVELSYDAALFLGVAQQMQGDRDSARASFERAEMLVPGAQSPLLAQSLLARREGNSAAALAPLGRLLATGNADRDVDDPWWSYEYSHVRDAALLMARMRRTFWAGSAP